MPEEYITPEELDKMLTFCHIDFTRSEENLKQLRDCFTISFLFFTALKPSEFKFTKVKDIDFEKLKLNAPTLKQGRVPTSYKDIEERLNNEEVIYTKIPLSHVPENHIELWKTYFEYFNLKSNDFIIDITVQWIGQRLAAVSEQTIHKKISPYVLRRSFGYYSADKGVKTNTLMNILRLSSVEMVKKYYSAEEITEDELEGVKNGYSYEFSKW